MYYNEYREPNYQIAFFDAEQNFKPFLSPSQFIKQKDLTQGELFRIKLFDKEIDFYYFQPALTENSADILGKNNLKAQDISYLITVVNSTNESTIKEKLSTGAWSPRIKILTTSPLHQGKNTEHVFEYQKGTQNITDHKKATRELIYFLAHILSLKVSKSDRANISWGILPSLPIEKKYNISFQATPTYYSIPSFDKKNPQEHFLLRGAEPRNLSNIQPYHGFKSILKKTS